MATFLESFDIRTAYPLLLFLLAAKLDGTAWAEISTLLESYLLRRTILGWPTKAYNRIFLNIAKSLRDAGPTPANLSNALSKLTGESSGCPTDEQFFAAWRNGNLYQQLNNAKLVHLLRRLNNEFLTNKNERISIDCPLTVEHILPQSWIEHWPLPSGDPGLTEKEFLEADDDNPRAVATVRRNSALQTIGNLTILTQELNSSVSNSAWTVRKPAVLNSSLLPINQQLHSYEIWDEAAIEQRSRDLFQKAIKIWPAPIP